MADIGHIGAADIGHTWTHTANIGHIGMDDIGHTGMHNIGHIGYWAHRCG